MSARSVLVVASICVLLSTAGRTSSADAATGFGIERYSLTAMNENGSVDTQAGSHPYELTAEAGLDFPAQSASEVKNLAFELPPGLTIDSNAVPRCTLVQFTGGECSNGTAVGVVQTSVAGTAMRAAVYNLNPAPEELAQLGFTLEGISVIADVTVRTDGNDGTTVSIHDIPQREISALKLTLWGVPADPGHDALRGGCLTGKETECASNASNAGFTTLPTSCAGPSQTTLQGDSWREEAASLSSSFVQMAGCERLRFEPSINVEPDTAEAGEPSGLVLHLRVPQSEDAGLASADLKEAVVTLPEGVGISISAANGRMACSEAEAGLGTPGSAMCSDASKVGDFKIEIPLVGGVDEKEVEGNIYVLQSNAPGLKLLLAASADGVSLKLVVNVELNPGTGQITLVMQELPQLPFGDLQLRFDGGVFALLVNPSSCGPAVTTSELTPWSGEATVAASSSYEVDRGIGGMPCSAPRPFGPVFQAGATNGGAGGYGSLTFLIKRLPQEEELSTVAIQVPQAVREMFTGVSSCGEAQASEGTCPASSQVGTVALALGSGPYPYYLTGSVYLTGPYRGAQQGLSIAVPFDPGPFVFGTLVIRASAQVDSQTGQMTILSDPLPGVADGIPISVDDLELQLSRGEFRLNPDGCEPPTVTGTLTSTQGALVAIAGEPLGISSTQCNLPQAAAISTLAASGVSPTTASVSLASTRIVTTRGREAAVRLTCTGKGTCAGRLILAVKAKNKKAEKRRTMTMTIGKADFSISSGSTTAVNVTLNVVGRELLSAARGRLSAILTVLKSLPAPSQRHAESVELLQQKIHGKTKR